MPPMVIDLGRADDWRDVVHQAVQTLAEGGVVAFPTETVYGLAASALDESAVERLLALKGRAANQPMALAVRSLDDARDYVPDMGSLALRLARRGWPGPITLVIDCSHPESLVKRLPPKVRSVVAPQGSVGLRVPGHPAILDVLRMLAGPLTLTSANKSGQPDAVTAREVLDAVGEDVDLVLDDGPCRFGQPSSVVRVTGDHLEVLREGVVPEKTLRRLSSLMLLLVCTGNTCRSPMAEILCRHLVAKRLGVEIGELEDHGVIVLSAGIAGMMGGVASREAVEAMKDYQLDLRGHETQPLTEPLVRNADFIYTMTRSHREAIVAQWPAAAERTFLLGADGSDISDPIGGPLERYRACAAQIYRHLETRLAAMELLPCRKADSTEE
ncbi:MAG: L-threonylcarbamoyladenylate synthase [Patescibacteria group bacterium]|nr:L-threonylcarbamoyladenylate synthase [Patescibacteria group bacterium]